MNLTSLHLGGDRFLAVKLSSVVHGDASSGDACFDAVSRLDRRNGTAVKEALSACRTCRGSSARYPHLLMTSY